MPIKSLLQTLYGKEFSDSICGVYIRLEEEFSLQHWRGSGVEAGHAVELIRRWLEAELFGGSINLKLTLNTLDDRELRRYENAPNKNASLRILIPRALKVVYDIRNKRGIAHYDQATIPNKIDATLTRDLVKWILAELLRLVSNQTEQETELLIEGLMEKKLPIIWQFENLPRVLPSNISLKNKILILLYVTKRLTVEDLIKSTLYKNKSRFNEIIADLNNNSLIGFDPTTHSCEISPKGILLVESITKDYLKNI